MSNTKPKTRGENFAESNKRVMEEIEEKFFQYLTEDSETKDARRKDFNQAIFDKDDGFAIFTGTDLDMVMEKLHKAIQSLKNT